MLRPDEIDALLNTDEHLLLERKANPNGQDIRRTLVAFANSVPEGEHAVLIMGQNPDRTLSGVQNTDEQQRSIRKEVEKAFPAIEYQVQLAQRDEKDLLFVIVAYQRQKPYFTGQCYLRQGSESVQASKKMHDELIARHHSKTARIMDFVGKKISVSYNGVQSIGVDCLLESADQWVTRIRYLCPTDGRTVVFSAPFAMSYSTEVISPCWDGGNDRLMLRVPKGG